MMIWSPTLCVWGSNNASVFIVDDHFREGLSKDHAMARKRWERPITARNVASARKKRSPHTRVLFDTRQNWPVASGQAGTFLAVTRLAISANDCAVTGLSRISLKPRRLAW